MVSVMMILGVYPFSTSTAAYKSLQRSNTYRWQPQERVGNNEALQYVGVGSETISLDGTLYPFYKGGVLQLPLIRELAELGEPQLLISGTGQLMGRWVITRITEGQTLHAAHGLPQRQEFTVELRKYDEGPGLGDL